MKTYYSYIRVSTARQGEGASLDVQKDTNANYAKQRGMKIVRDFEEMETAAKQGRAVFNEMIALVKARKADGVIIHKIDRSARNLKDWAEIAHLIDMGIEVHFSHESLDMQARGGRLSADIQAVIAADYIRNLRQEAIKGLYGRLKQGIYPFYAPVGYNNNGGGKQKTPDPIQAPLVRKAFELYATRKFSLEKLVPQMQRLGLRNTRGGKVHLNGLSLILNNPFYCGILKVKGQSYKGGHEAIISTTLFSRVQAILQGNTNQKIIKHEFLFSKRIKCLHCKFSMIGEKQKGHNYYRCHTKGCPTKSMRETTVENLLEKALVLPEIQEPEKIKMFAHLDGIEKSNSEKQKEFLASLNLQKGQIQQKIERITDIYIDNGIDKETYEKKKSSLLFEFKGMEEREHVITSKQGDVYKRTRQFLELASSLTKSYKKGIFEEKRELLETATSNLYILGKKLIVSMRLPFSDMAERHNFELCGHNRDTPRKTYEGIAKNGICGHNRDAARKTYEDSAQSDKKTRYGTFVFSEVNTSPIIGQSLSDEKLKMLLDHLLRVISQLPDDNFRKEYDV